MKKNFSSKLDVIITMDTEYYKSVLICIIAIGRAKGCQITKKWGREKQTAKFLILDQHQIKDMRFKASQHNLNT